MKQADFEAKGRPRGSVGGWHSPECSRVGSGGEDWAQWVRSQIRVPGQTRTGQGLFAAWGQKAKALVRSQSWQTTWGQGWAGEPLPSTPPAKQTALLDSIFLTFPSPLALTQSPRSLQIVASDCGTPPRKKDRILQVTILDVNDNPPVIESPFGYNVSVNEVRTAPVTVQLDIHGGQWAQANHETPIEISAWPTSLRTGDGHKGFLIHDSNSNA